ncbi:MAG: hypothetical protein RLZZ584_1731 [Pseudomonadota bacterium]|jgi:hypothetical protein
MPSYLLTFDDSEVATVQAGPGEVIVCFAAAHVQQLDPAPPEGTPGDRPQGYVRHLVLHLATMAGAPGAALPPDLYGRIAAGGLGIDGRRWRQLAVPGEFSGELLLDLDFANRSTLTLRAHAARLGFDGDPQFTESLAC